MITLAMLRARRRDLAATFAALGLGTAISAAALTVHTQATPQAPPEYAAAGVLVQAPEAAADDDPYAEYLPWSVERADELAAAMAARPGVAAAVPVREFYAQLVLDGKAAGNPDPDLPEGRTWSTATLAPYRITAGRAPSGDGEVAVSDDFPVRPGERVTLLTGPGRRSVTVSGTVAGPGIYLPDDAGRRLAAGSTLIGVVTAPDTDPDRLAADLRPLLPRGATLFAGDERVGAEPEGTARTRYLGTQLLTVMLLLACFAAILVTSQTFALAASHQRQDVALLRAIGATPGQIRRLSLLEAGAVGLIAGAAGATLGTMLAPWLGATLVRAGLEPTGFAVDPDPAIALLLALLGPVIAVAATWGTSRRSGRVAPLEAVRAAQVDVRRLGPWRLAAGILASVAAVAAGLGAATARPSRTALLATLATLLVIAAVTWLAPVVLPPVVRVLTWPLGRTRHPAGILVRGAMTTAAARTAATAAPVLATVAFATLVVGYVETARGAYAPADVPAGTSAVVAPDAAPGLTEETVTRVRELAARGGGPDVADELLTKAFTGSGDRLAESLASGERGQPAGTVTVSGALARQHDWRAGDQVPVVLADGTRVRLRVTAASDRTGVAGLVLPRSLVRAHDPSALTPLLLLRDLPPERLAGVAGPGVLALSPAAYAFSAVDAEYRLLQIFVAVILGLSLGYTGLAIANTILMATGARRGDLTLLRLAGATPRQVITSLAGEAGLTVVIGSALGVLAGLSGLLVVRRGLAEELGREVAVALPWTVLATLAGACLVIAVAAAVWPAWRMVRDAPVPSAAT